MLESNRREPNPFVPADFEPITDPEAAISELLVLTAFPAEEINDEALFKALANIYASRKTKDWRQSVPLQLEMTEKGSITLRYFSPVEFTPWASSSWESEKPIEDLESYYEFRFYGDGSTMVCRWVPETRKHKPVALNPKQRESILQTLVNATLHNDK